MKKLVTLVFFMVACVGSYAQLSGSYTIDPSQSASSSNYTDIVSAVFDLTQSSGNRPDGGPRNGPGVSGAVDFVISPGTYRGQLLLSPISGTSSSNTVTFRSQNNSTRGVIIADSAATSAQLGTVKVLGADYVSFQYVTIRPLNKVWPSGFSTGVIIDSSGADVSSFVNFYGCRIESNWYITSKNQTSVYINGYQNDVSLVKDTFYNASCAVNVVGNRNFGDYTKNLTIDSCAFIVSGSDVFQPFNIRYVRNLAITHNSMVKNGCCADRMGQFFGLRAPVEISYNKFYYQTGSSSGNGFDFDSVNLFNDNAPVRIYNNFFQSNYYSSGNMLRFSRTADTWVVNNSFYTTGGASGFNMIETYATDSNTHKNLNIINNLFISNAANIINVTGSNQAVALKAFGRVNYNNIYRLGNTSQTIYTILGNKISNQANIAGVLYNGSDSATDFAVASYIGSNNLHLNKTTCLYGTPVSFVNDDIDGNTRNNPPFIGGDEITGIANNNDIGIVKIISPNSSVYTAGSQDLTILVKNFGTNTVNSFDANYTLNGGSKVTTSFSGTLNPCDTVSITFTGANQINLSSGSYFVKIYTDNLNNGLDSNRVNDTLTNTYCATLSGNYTIDPAQASSATNFTNFTSLANTLNSCGISGQVNVSVAAGTYLEHVVFGVIPGNDSNTMVIIDGGSASTTVLKGNAFRSGVNYVYRNDGAKGVMFRNLTFRSDTGTTGYLVQLMGGQKFAASNCILDYNGTAANSGNGSLSAVMISASATGSGNSANIANITFDSCVFNKGYYSFYSNLSYGNLLRIRYSKFNQPAGSAVWANSGGLQFIHNKVSMRSANSNYGLFLINQNSNNSNNNSQICENVISEIGQYGIFMSSCYGYNSNNKAQFYNNMIGGKFMSSGACYGVYFQYSNNWKIYHNTISIASTNGSKNEAWYAGGSGSYSNEYFNNSFSIDAASANSAIPVDFAISGAAISNGVDFNNYYNAANNDLFNIAGTVYTTSTFQAAYPSGGGANSFEGAPTFNGVTDLHVTGNQLNDRGNYVSVDYDIDGDTRNNTTPDIGADEYASINHSDLSLNKLINPAIAACLGGTKLTITGEVKNMGIDTIDLTTDTVWVGAKVEDPNGNLTYYGPVTLTGVVLYPQNTQQVDITTAFDMSIAGTYYISPYLYWAKDSNILNDTLKNQGRDMTNPVPIWSPYPSKTAVCNGDSVKLSLANSTNTTDFAWIDVNGYINGAWDSVYLAPAAGFYLCELSNFQCTVQSDTIYITSGTNPVATINTNKTLFCQGDSALLTSGYNANYSYQWTYNGNVITGATDTIYYALNGGKYNVVVSEKSSGCSVVSSDVTLTVNPGPTANLTNSNNGNVCQGDSLQLDVTQSAGSSYQWTINGNTITGANGATIYATASGNYQAIVTGANGCATKSNITTVTVNQLPNNTVQITGKTQACGTDTVYLDAVNNTGNTFVWMKNGNVINGANGGQLMVLTGGSYTVKITDANSCVNTSTAVNINFSPVPSIPSLNGASGNICPGDSMKISVSPADTGSFTFQWKLNGNDINGATDSVLYAKSAGSYSAQVINNGGCSNITSGSISIALNPAPAPVLSAAGATTICAGDSVNLSAANTATGITSVSWLLNSNAFSAGGNANPLYVNASGLYNAIVTDNNGCKGTSNAINVTVNPLPSPTITEDKPNSKLSTGVFSTYQWYLNGNVINGATTQTIRIYSNGDYSVEVTDANGCKNKSAVNTVNWYVGISSINAPAGVKVYPNPSSGMFNLELPVGMENNRIRLMDMAGREVSGNIRNANGICTIDLTSQAAGVYILQMNYNGETSQIRLIKY